MSVQIQDPSALVRSIDGPRLSLPFSLVQRLGDIAMAAFISQGAYLSSISPDTDGWFDLPQVGAPDAGSPHLFGRLGSWQAMLALGPDAQVAVRRQLKKLGLLEEKRTGIPARLHYRVRPAAYLAFLAAETSNGCEDKLDSDKSGNKSPMQSGSCNVQSLEQEPRNSQNYSRDHSVDQTSLLQPTQTQPGDYGSVVVGNRQTLHFPPVLAGERRQSAELAIGRCPETQRQAVLDEVDGICRRGRLQGNPIGLLNTLCQRAAAGTFTPSLGLDIAGQRAAEVPDKGASPPTKTASREATRRALSEMHAIVSRHTNVDAIPSSAPSTSSIRTRSAPAGGASHLSHHGTDNT